MATLHRNGDLGGPPRHLPEGLAGALTVFGAHLLAGSPGLETTRCIRASMTRLQTMASTPLWRGLSNPQIPQATRCTLNPPPRSALFLVHPRGYLQRSALLYSALCWRLPGTIVLQNPHHHHYSTLPFPTGPRAPRFLCRQAEMGRWIER